MPKTKRGRKKTKRGSVKTLKLQTKGSPDEFEKMDIKEFIDLISYKKKTILNEDDIKDEQIQGPRTRFEKLSGLGKTEKKERADKAVKYYSTFKNWKDIKNSSILEFKNHFMKYVFSKSIKGSRLKIKYERKTYIKKLKNIFEHSFNKKIYKKRLQKTCDDSELLYNYFVDNVITRIGVKSYKNKHKIVKNIYNDVDYFYDNYLNVENPDENDEILQEVLKSMNTNDKGNKIFASNMYRPYQLDPNELTEVEKKDLPKALGLIKPRESNTFKYDGKEEFLRRMSGSMSEIDNNKAPLLPGPPGPPDSPSPSLKSKAPSLQPKPSKEEIDRMFKSAETSRYTRKSRKSPSRIMSTRKNSPRNMGTEKFKKMLDKLERK